MRIRFIWPGKTKDEHLRALVEEYLKRLTRFVRCEVIETREGTSADPASVKKESERILEAIPPASVALLLDVKGLEWDSPELAKAYESDSQIRELLDTARKLEGLVRNSGVHAAGVVISPKPLTELVPLHRTKNDEIVTAFDMGAIEKLGLLKMDFLGLTTLTILADALKLIQQTRGVTLSLEQIPLEDQETYQKVFHKGLTSGVFQFESGGMRDVLRRYHPDSIEHLTALNALYRPGPIQGGMIDEFIERKWGRRAVEYELPELEPILSETLGVMLYQEQVMQISNRLAGFSLSQADMLRRAMGKKDAAEMAKQKIKFMEGAADNKHPKAVAGNIFDLMAKFAREAAEQGIGEDPRQIERPQQFPMPKCFARRSKSNSARL